MEGFTIPILSYAFIGITTLVLTYATIMDTEPLTENKSKSVANLLQSVSSTTQSSTPSIQEAKPVSNTTMSSVPMAIANAVSNPLGPTPPQASGPQLKIGGKTKRRKNKTKHNKSKHTKF